MKIDRETIDDDEPDDEGEELNPLTAVLNPTGLAVPFVHPSELATETDDAGMQKRVGRPSKYQPEYGAAIVKLMAQGFSLNAASAKLGLLKDTANDWAASVPEFSELLKLAKGLRVFHLEAVALHNPKLSSAQASVYLRALSRANPQDFGEALANDHSGSVAELRDTLLKLGRELHERLVRSSNVEVEGEYVTVGEEDRPTSTREILAPAHVNALPVQSTQEKTPGD